MTIAKKYEDVVAERDAALAREAALREEMEQARATGKSYMEISEELQQRLTVAEQRAEMLEREFKKLRDVAHGCFQIASSYSGCIDGVERELLERWEEKLRTPAGRQELLEGLRALLDKPVAERKPFAWYRVPKDFPLQGAFFPYIEGHSERDIQNSLEAEFGFDVKRLYDDPPAQHQHQGEPVAKAKPVAKLHAERLTGRDGEYGVTVEDSEWFNTCRLTGGIFNLYAEQPAPVVTLSKLMQAFMT